MLSDFSTVLLQTLFFWEFILCLRSSSRIGYRIFAPICALIALVVFVGRIILANTSDIEYLLVFGASFIFLIFLVLDNSRKSKIVKLEITQNEAGSSKGLLKGAAAAVEQYGLTPREGEVLFLLAQGRSTPHIEKNLSLANGTVRTHVQHIYSKLRVHSKQQLIDLVTQLDEE
jgi:DNA-binding CsgD family transcriptional regulator